MRAGALTAWIFVLSLESAGVSAQDELGALRPAVCGRRSDEDCLRRITGSLPIAARRKRALLYLVAGLLLRDAGDSAGARRAARWSLALYDSRRARALLASLPAPGSYEVETPDEASPPARVTSGALSLVHFVESSYGFAGGTGTTTSEVLVAPGNEPTLELLTENIVEWFGREGPGGYLSRTVRVEMASDMLVVHALTDEGAGIDAYDRPPAGCLEPPSSNETYPLPMCLGEVRLHLVDGAFVPAPARRARARRQERDHPRPGRTDAPADRATQ